ncbi:MAG: AAA family ATPase [Candidatus Thorarchaeota archaeon]|nr:AAA family ATPase [Candidatus Thorarchaeota archaeon]
MEPVLWSIKYRPKTWEEFYGQEQAINQLKSYAESRTIPHLILYGPAGTGKTVAAQIYAKKTLGDAFNSNFKTLNVRDIRSYSIAKAKRKISALAKLDRSKRSELDEYMSVVFREAKASLKVKGQTRNPNRSQLLHQAISLFASTITVADDPLKILVLEESDALDKNMLQALRRTMERYSGVCRFVLVTPSLAGWNPAIASRCVVIRFPAISAEHTEAILSDIASKEGVDIEPLGMKALVRASGGDARRAIDLLQICATDEGNVTEDLVHTHSDTPLTKGVRTMISSALKNDFVKARDILRRLLTSEQYSPTQVMVQIQREVVKRPLGDTKMRHLIDRMSEIDYRMTQGKNPHIHLMALLASIGNLPENEAQ